MRPFLTIASLHAAYAGGLDPVAVVDATFAAIADAGDPGIFISLAGVEDARAAARALGAFDPLAKPLWGVPFAVKDNIDVAGFVTTAGCPEFAYRAGQSAHAVGRLVKAGAVPIGKTNLDQFAAGLVGVRTPYPAPRNAIDPAIVPGGSSSGSAVAVARGLVPFALGTDTAGSGRVPAALNNIVGLKPSLGMVSTRGVVPACRTLDCVSVFALCVGDAWRVAGVLADYDAADPFARDIALSPCRLPPGVRVGVPDAGSRRFFGDGLAEAAFDAALDDLGALGIATVGIDMSVFFEAAALLYEGPWVAERYQAIRTFFDGNAQALHPVTRAIVAGAARHSAADAFAGIYRLAELRRAARHTWDLVDVLAVPTVPTLYTVEDVAAEPVLLNSRLGTYTNFVNLLDLCALAVPGRLRADGRPAGVTFIAPAGRDGTLAALGGPMHARAGVLLGATGQAMPTAAPPPIAAPPTTEQKLIEIAVVGAHLSGLPLNHELTDVGGRLVRCVRTEPCYRLFELPGGAPKRPGLLRVAADGGHAIEVEVWGLPPDAFGSFVAAIAAPLGIGTVRLQDGSTPKGFLVEAEGVTGARDISGYGGWRAFLLDRCALS